MDEIRVGKVLILISSLYILLTLPHTIDQFHYLLYQPENQGDSYKNRFNGIDEIFASLSYLLLTFNYSLNFYFYCLINQDIRKDVRNFLNKHFHNCMQIVPAFQLFNDKLRIQTMKFISQNFSVESGKQFSSHVFIIILTVIIIIIAIANVKVISVHYP